MKKHVIQIVFTNPRYPCPDAKHLIGQKKRPEMTMTGDKEKISAKLLIPEANNITIKVSFKNKWKGSSRLAGTWFG